MRLEELKLFYWSFTRIDWLFCITREQARFCNSVFTEYSVQLYTLYIFFCFKNGFNYVTEHKSLAMEALLAYENAPRVGQKYFFDFYLIHLLKW